MKCIVNGDVVLSRPLEGPLSAHIAAFAAWAREQGYARRSRYRQVRLGRYQPGDQLLGFLNSR